MKTPPTTYQLALIAATLCDITRFYEPDLLVRRAAMLFEACEDYLARFPKPEPITITSDSRTVICPNCQKQMPSIGAFSWACYTCRHIWSIAPQFESLMPKPEV
jgi:hypothetical protein